MICWAPFPKTDMKANKVLNRLLGVVIVVLVCWVVYDQFDIGTRITLHRAISNISTGRDLANARATRSAS